jgi:hypothetical protein
MKPILAKEIVMRTILAFTVGALLGVGVVAGHDHIASDMKVFSAEDIAEKVDGKDTRATTYEVAIEPGKGSMPHRHPARCSPTSWRANTSGPSKTIR